MSAIVELTPTLTGLRRCHGLFKLLSELDLERSIGMRWRLVQIAMMNYCVTCDLRVHDCKCQTADYLEKDKVSTGDRL